MLRRTWATMLTVLVAASAAATAGYAVTASSSAATPAAASRVLCAKVGATASVVRKIFGRHALPSDVRSPSTTYCQITPAGAATTGPEVGCSSIECTDVFVTASAFAATVSAQVMELKEYGHGRVSTHAVRGAGPGAVLVTDTHYGEPSEGLGPVLLLRAGSRTISIQGSLGGPPVPTKWERLARAIHAHLG